MKLIRNILSFCFAIVAVAFGCFAFCLLISENPATENWVIAQLQTWGYAALAGIVCAICGVIANLLSTN